MKEYIEYVQTLKTVLQYIRDRAHADLNKTVHLFGLPIGRPNREIYDYINTLETIILESVFVHAFASTEKDLFNDVKTTLENTQVTLTNGYLPRYVLHVEQLIKNNNDIDGLASLLKINGQKQAEISKYKKLRDYIAHGKRYPGNEVVNSVDLNKEIIDILKNIELPGALSNANNPDII